MIFKEYFTSLRYCWKGEFTTVVPLMKAPIPKDSGIAVLYLPWVFLCTSNVVKTEILASSAPSGTAPD